ncbi:PREDICTED: inner centromere protein isoform X2 [Chinchilla lanigera]|uniref:Inner centromere protein n=1 Tax=Chinchilla lanigera TaxID=34839 RepID=A0A8C2V2G6_CHILA|nr:PREDICTED: inner centromere protein isoform X2 [Chinchilla lanigera]
MGTAAPGPLHLLDLCDQKLMDFVCNMDNKDLVWLREIQEEAERMFTREFSKEPELMPKTPSQKNRRRKRRVSYVQDENRNPIRKRSSRRKIRSGRRSSQPLRGKDRVEKPAMAFGEQGSPVLRRVTRAAAAAASKVSAAPVCSPRSPTEQSRKLVVEIGAVERRSAEQQLTQLVATSAPTPTPAPAAAAQDDLTLVEESTPKKPEAGRPESVTASALVTTPQGPRSHGAGPARSACKLKIAQASPGPQDAPGSRDSPWRERVLTSIQPDNFSRPVRRSLIAPAPQDTVAQKYPLVAKQEGASRRSSRRVAKNAATEPAASGRIICHSYLERLLNVEVPQKLGPKQEEPSGEAEAEAAEAKPEVPGSSGDPLLPRGAAETTVHTPHAQPAPAGWDMSPEGQQGATADEADGHREPPQSVRRKRSYKRAMSELDEEPSLVDEELQPPRNKTPSPPCPASKVVRPLRTFLHTVQRNQLLMTPTSAPRGTVMKSFIKRNTPLRVDPKEKERQRLENLRRKEEAEQLRKQKVEEEKRRRREEEKMKREERHRKVLQARERVEQMKEEKKKQMEQKIAQLEEKTEKAKEERQAEEKARKKAMAKKMEEAEARRRQEEEARRLRRLQQEEEERRHQELLQKRKEEEQERLRKVAEARRLAEQREQERRREQERLQAERELQEREKALRLQRELEEKKKEEEQRLAEQRLQEQQEKKAREEAVAAGANKALNVTVDVQSPACTSYQMTPQGHKHPPKINLDNYCNYGMDLNSDDSTDDEAHPRKPIPAWARGTQLSQTIVHQYYHPPNLTELFGTILPLDLEDIFKKSKPRYHKRTSSAVWNSPPLQGTRVPSSLAYSLKKY